MKKITSLLILILLTGMLQPISGQNNTGVNTQELKISVAGIQGGDIRADMLISNSLTTNMAGLTVKSFTVTMNINGDLLSIVVTGDKLNKDAANHVRTLPAGSKVFLENVNCTDNAGNLYTAPPVVFVIAAL